MYVVALKRESCAGIHKKWEKIGQDISNILIALNLMLLTTRNAKREKGSTFIHSCH
jgi:hypothetical protein